MRIFKQYCFIFVLLLFFIIGLAIRTYEISKVPPGFDWDERSFSYNAFAIAKTGRDEWGVRFPIIFKAFGDYKLPLHIYLTSLFVKFLGLNIFSAKMVSILTGSLSIITIFFLAYAFTKNKLASLISSLFLTFSPYSVFFSRLGIEVMLSSFLIILGITLELYYLRKKQKRYFYLSLFFLTLSFYSYNLARIVSPVLIIASFIINYLLKNDRLNKTGQDLWLLLLIFLLIFFQFKTDSGARFKATSMFGEDKGMVLEINELRSHEKLNFKSKLFHNKVIFYFVNIVGNYVGHFSTDFLVNYWGYDVVQESIFPPFFLIMLPFYYFGLFLLIRDIVTKKNSVDKYLKIIVLVWILISPFPSAITEGSPSSKRYLGALGSFELITAFGLVNILKLTKEPIRKKLLLLFLSLYSLSIIYFLHNYFIIFPNKYDYMYAYRENIICELIKSNYAKYDYFVYSRTVANQPYILPLFCLSYPPQKFITQKKWTERKGWFYVDSFDKFIFFDQLNPTVIQQLPKSGRQIALFLTKNERQNIDLQIKNIVSHEKVFKSNDEREVVYFVSIKL